MKITNSAFEKAVSKNLAVGKRVGSVEVRKSLEKVGVNLKFKGQVKESQVKAAFDQLKKEGLLKRSSESQGTVAFRQSVGKAVEKETNPGMSAAQKLAHAKALLRERQVEDETKRKRIGEALSGGKPVAGKPGPKGGDASSSGGHAPRVAVAGGAIAGAAEHESGPAKVYSSFSSGSFAKKGASEPAPKKAEPEEPAEPPDIFGY